MPITAMLLHVRLLSCLEPPPINHVNRASRVLGLESRKRCPEQKPKTRASERPTSRL